MAGTNGNVGIGTSSPWANFSLELGTQDAALAVSNLGSTTPSLYIGGVNQNGFVGFGTTTNLSSLARVTMSALFTNETGTTNAIGGMYQNFTFSPTTNNTAQVGNRLVINNSPSGSNATNTSIAQIIRTIDNSNISNLVRGLEVISSAGNNVYGVNTGIRTTGHTFGIQGITTGLAGGTSTPAAIYGESLGSTQGDIMRLYSATITSAPQMAIFYQEVQTFTGDGLAMNLGKGGGSFTGNFLKFKVNDNQKFQVSNTGTTTIGQSNQTIETAGLLIPFGSICVDDDGNCTGTTTGAVAAVSFLTGHTADLAENYYSSDSLDSGEIVYAMGGAKVGRASTGNNPVVGVVSTKPALALSAEYKNPAFTNKYPIGLTGRIPVRISNENGDIKIGDRIVVSNISGIGMKDIGEPNTTTVGIALEDFDGTKYLSDGVVEIETLTVNTEPVCTLKAVTRDTRIGGGADSELSANQTQIDGVVYERVCQSEKIDVAPENASAMDSVTSTGKNVKVGKIMMFIKLEQSKLTLGSTLTNDINSAFSIDSTTGLVNVSRSMNFMSHEMVDVAKISFIGGKLFIDAEGNIQAVNITANNIKAKDSLEVGTEEKPTGITIYDEQTKQPYCLKMSGGSISTTAGKCATATTTPVSNTATVIESVKTDTSTTTNSTNTPVVESTDSTTTTPTETIPTTESTTTDTSSTTPIDTTTTIDTGQNLEISTSTP